jgi:PKD repeat protein
VSLTTGDWISSDTETKTGIIAVLAPPEAEFSASPAEGSAPLAVRFTDESTGTITSWEWDFDGDGTADSIEQNPSHTYGTPGTYTVSLRVGNGIPANTNTKVAHIRVLAPAQARFAASSTRGEAPFTVYFTDQSEGNVGTWEWDLDGDGTVDSNEQNPSHVYETSDSYTVSLTVHGATSSTETKTDYIKVVAPPQADFSASPRSGTVPLTVQFTDESTGDIAYWQWDFDDDGIVDSTEQNPSHTYSATGSYTVSLTVGDLTSHTETKTYHVRVSAPPPPPPNGGGGGEGEGEEPS